MYETPLPKVVREDDAGTVARPVELGRERVDVVAVDLHRLPAERLEAVGERLEVEHLARVAERLLPVGVDNRSEAPEAVVRGEHRRLPERALVALGVADQHEDAPLRALHPTCQGRTCANG